MQPPSVTRIKICCIANIQEACAAIESGASAIGLVSAMPSGPGVIPENDISLIARTIPPGVASFLLTSHTDPDAIIAQHRRCRTTVIQLVDAVAIPALEKVRDVLSGTRLVQVIHVRGEESVDEAVAVASHVDALLLDSGNPTLAVKELGGTGRTHNWSISRRIREAVDIPVFLAGGLNAGNVADAIAGVGPFGVDVCSGVRTDGVLDRTKLQEFFTAVRSTFSLSRA